MLDGGLGESGISPNSKGPLAQSVEQLTLNQRVAGSIPARPTNYFGERHHFFLRLDNGEMPDLGAKKKSNNSLSSPVKV